MNKALSVIGIIVTISYTIFLYFLTQDEISNFSSMKLNNIGDFLAGVFGPLAIFWLILGFFQQGKELKQSTQALEIQAEELKKSVEQHKELVEMTKLQLKTDKEKQEEQSSTAHDKEIISQVTRSLTWAYDALEINPENKMPYPNRLSWLTSARHIMRYYKLRDSLQTDTYQTICEEYEEYWRQKFYLLFNNPEFRLEKYFINQEIPVWPENIEIRSAMILSVFSQWNDDEVDPIDDISKKELIKNKAFRGSALGAGIKSYSNTLAKARELMNK